MKKIITLVTALGLSMIVVNASAYEFPNSSTKAVPQNSFKIRTKGHGGRGDDGIKGKVIVHAGIGLNLLTTNLSVRYALSAAYENADYLPTFKQIPMINLGLDYGLGKKFSLGVAFGYQKATATYNYYPYNFTDKWTRIHFAFRGDYHIVAKDNLALYTGLKVGYNIYTVTSDFPGSTSYTKDTYISELSKPSAISTQVHFGFSYFFSGVIGVNAEAGIGCDLVH